MKIKALKSFSGLITMTAGEERNVRDVIAKDLINAKYAKNLDEPETDSGEKKPKKLK